MVEITGPLGFKILEEAYLSISYGNNEPDFIRCSPRTRERLISLVTDPNVVYKKFKFNDALIEATSNLRDDEIVIGYTDPKVVKALATNAGAKHKDEYPEYTTAIIHIQEGK